MNDNVNSPKHYTSCPSGLETIHKMIRLYGQEAVYYYCLCNAMKYRERAGIKSDRIEEDIAKAQWYENKARELNNEFSLTV